MEIIVHNSLISSSLANILAERDTIPANTFLREFSYEPLDQSKTPGILLLYEFLMKPLEGFLKKPLDELHNGKTFERISEEFSVKHSEGIAKEIFRRIYEFLREFLR